MVFFPVLLYSGVLVLEYLWVEPEEPEEGGGGGRLSLLREQRVGGVQHSVSSHHVALLANKCSGFFFEVQSRFTFYSA
jgi:hypothetical protein